MEYKKYIQKDPAFERRFGIIYINEPSKDEVFSILKFLKPSYSEYHNINIDDELLKELITLVDVYIAHNYFPDKAISILDYACADANINLNKEIYRIHIKPLIEKKIKLTNKQGKVKTNTRKKIIERDIYDVDQEIKSTFKKLSKTNPKLSISNILKAIEKSTNMKIFTKQNIHTLENAIFATSYPKEFKEIRQYILEKIVTIEKPIGIHLIFKNSQEIDIIDEINEWLFHTNHPTIKFDMNLFNTRESLANFLGPNPGFSGYTEFVSPFDSLTYTPACIVIFENFEKAHIFIREWIDHIIKVGWFVDNKGKKYSLRNAIILFTSQNAKRVLRNPLIKQISF